MVPQQANLGLHQNSFNSISAHLTRTKTDRRLLPVSPLSGHYLKQQRHRATTVRSPTLPRAYPHSVLTYSRAPIEYQAGTRSDRGPGPTLVPSDSSVSTSGRSRRSGRSCRLRQGSLCNCSDILHSRYTQHHLGYRYTSCIETVSTVVIELTDRVLIRYRYT